MTMKKIRAEVELFNEEGDFSLWTIRMMAHFGLSGLKKVVLSDNFEIEVPLTKEEGKKVADGDEDESKGSQTKMVLDPIKLEKDEFKTIFVCDPLDSSSSPSTIRCCERLSIVRRLRPCGLCLRDCTCQDRLQIESLFNHISTRLSVMDPSLLR